MLLKNLFRCVRRGARARKATRLRLPEKAFFTVVRLALSVPGSPPVSVFSVGSFRCVRRLGHLGRLRTGWALLAPHLFLCSRSGLFGASGGLGTSAGSALAALSGVAPGCWFRCGSWGRSGACGCPYGFLLCAVFTRPVVFLCAVFTNPTFRCVFGCFGVLRSQKNARKHKPTSQKTYFAKLPIFTKRNDFTKKERGTAAVSKQVSERPETGSHRAGQRYGHRRRAWRPQLRHLALQTMPGARRQAPHWPPHFAACYIWAAGIGPHRFATRGISIGRKEGKNKAKRAT